VELAPEWVAMEQVPAVLPLWRALAHVLERHGYSTWCGVLCAADYGVPQARRRAILMASRVGAVSPPVPTHAERPGMFGERPWVTWDSVLGLPSSCVVEGRRGAGMIERHGEREATPAGVPYPTVTGGFHRRHWIIDRRTNSRAAGGGIEPMVPVQSGHRAPTLTGQAVGQWVIQSGPDRYKLTLAGALVLQGFDPTYPVRGESKEARSVQIGNAVPPPLAAHIVAALTGAQVLRAAS